MWSQRRICVGLNRDVFKCPISPLGHSTYILETTLEQSFREVLNHFKRPSVRQECFRNVSRKYKLD